MISIASTTILANTNSEPIDLAITNPGITNPTTIDPAMINSTTTNPVTSEMAGKYKASIPKPSVEKSNHFNNRHGGFSPIKLQSGIPNYDL